jgi:hypothetical protein
MPAERRSFTAARPVKTERTHEENQERYVFAARCPSSFVTDSSSAYIAASRRSDRSLEARIESARRASEIHKKRTGRALRVTEQDVINEEMYEEEDDDLPTQYQRLNAHLHTTSVMFNKKLHDYIATQHGVRNMFMSQYQNAQFQPYGGQFASSANTFPQTNNWLNPSMAPPQQITPSTTPQAFQQPSSLNAGANAAAQQNFRSSPYYVPQRPQPHQRSASIQLPHAPSQYGASAQSATPGATTPHTLLDRRMSLPVHSFEQSTQAASGAQSPPVLSRSSTVNSPRQQPISPRTESCASPLSGTGQRTPYLHTDTDTPASLPFTPMDLNMNSQVLGSNPLSLSLPPESQQFLGSVLDPNDPRTAMFMAGSENLAQPFTPTYTYNPNYSPKSIKAANGGSTMTLTLPQKAVKSEGAAPTSTAATPISEGLYSNDAFLTPGNEGYGAFFDFQSTDFAQPGDEQGSNEQLVDGSSFVNWD